MIFYEQKKRVKNLNSQIFYEQTFTDTLNLLWYIFHVSNQFNSNFWEKRKPTKPFLPFFENFNQDFGTVGIKIIEIWLQIRIRRPRNWYVFWVTPNVKKHTIFPNKIEGQISYDERSYLQVCYFKHKKQKQLGERELKIFRRLPFWTSACF